MVGLRLLNRLQRGLQVGARSEGGLAVILQRLYGVAEVIGARNIKLINRRAIVQQLQ